MTALFIVAMQGNMYNEHRKLERSLTISTE